ncbi:hypothetical protein CBS101457_000264 [Exobasidium rhododendri]|nr:hypothetical protein CBS101457_000264 [Exobasidium rhododendri]
MPLPMDGSWRDIPPPSVRRVRTRPARSGQDDVQALPGAQTARIGHDRGNTLLDMGSQSVRLNMQSGGHARASSSRGKGIARQEMISEEVATQPEFAYPYGGSNSYDPFAYQSSAYGQSGMSSQLPSQDFFSSKNDDSFGTPFAHQFDTPSYVSSHGMQESAPYLNLLSSNVDPSNYMTDFYASQSSTYNPQQYWAGGGFSTSHPTHADPTYSLPADNVSHLPAYPQQVFPPQQATLPQQPYIDVEDDDEDDGQLVAGQTQTTHQPTQIDLNQNIQLTPPITDFGFTWHDGNMVCWNSFYSAHRNMMVNIVRGETGYTHVLVRRKMRPYMTPFRALNLLSGNEALIRGVVNDLFPNYYHESKDQWKNRLDDNQAEKLLELMAHTTSQDKDYIRYYFSRKNVTADIAYDLFHGTDIERAIYAMRGNIVKKHRPALVQEEPVMKEGDRNYRPWKEGTTQSQRNEVMAFAQAMYDNCNMSWIYRIFDTKSILSSYKFGLNVYYYLQAGDEQGARAYIKLMTGVTPRSERVTL